MRDVSKAFDGGRIRAVERVSISIEQGESIAVVGPSGSGKTTLMNLACGLDRADEGEVAIDGGIVRGMGAWTAIRRTTIGIVFQAFHLLGALTAEQNVEIPLIGAGIPAADRRVRARACLESVGLGGRLDHLPATLSGGERQRVAIARAIANEPRLLLADEPTGSLDSASSNAIVDLLVGLVRSAGMSLLVVTHDDRVARRMDRIVTLLDGRVAREY